MIICDGLKCGECGACEDPLPECPVCGEECYTFYKHDDKILGCENCVKETESCVDD